MGQGLKASASNFCNSNNNGNSNYNDASNANRYVRPRFEWHVKTTFCHTCFTKETLSLLLKVNSTHDADEYV